MKPMICAGCAASLTMGIWESKSERVFCPACVPPLAGPGESAYPGRKGTLPLRRRGRPSDPSPGD
jgi:hypothetical protein